MQRKTLHVLSCHGLVGINFQMFVMKILKSKNRKIAMVMDGELEQGNNEVQII